MKDFEITRDEIIKGFQQLAIIPNSTHVELIKNGIIKEFNKDYFKINLKNESYFITFEPVAQLYGDRLEINIIYKIYKNRIIGNDPIYIFER